MLKLTMLKLEEQRCKRKTKQLIVNEMLNNYSHNS